MESLLLKQSTSIWNKEDMIIKTEVHSKPFMSKISFKPDFEKWFDIAVVCSFWISPLNCKSKKNNNIFTVLKLFFKALNFRFWRVSQCFDLLNLQLFEPVSPVPQNNRGHHIGNPSIPPHSLVAFGLFLRLPGYAEVLLKERKKAQCLLRLMLGVTDDGGGGEECIVFCFVEF